MIMKSYKYEFVFACKAVKNILKSMQFKSWLNSYKIHTLEFMIMKSYRNS